MTRYVMASSWNDLVKALRNSVGYTRSGFDELVQVKERRKCQGPIWQPKNTRVVVYDKVDDIPSLLQSEVPIFAETRNTPNQHNPPPPATALVPTEVPSELAVDEADEDDEPSPPEEVEVDHVVDTEAATRAAEFAQVYQPPPVPSDEELAAAAVFVKAYKLLIRRRRGAQRKELAEARAQWYDKFYLQVQNIPRPYRCLYLGPLPHALLCIEGVINHAIDAKKLAKSRLRRAQHEDYERIHSGLNTASYAKFML